MIYDTIIIGGGQAGLAMGHTLRQQANNRFLILEAGPEAVGSWPNSYDSLKLFSPARYSSLPGMPFLGDPDAYPTRDEVIGYLQTYAKRFQLPIVTNARVEQVRIEKGRYYIQTATETYQARTIVAATGSFHKPNLPTYPNQASFDGTILHSSRYRSPLPFAGKRVIVVGAGNSALQIAVELAQHATVTLATRGPLTLAPPSIAGKDIHFWLKWSGLDALPIGYRPKFADQLLDKVSVIDVGGFKEILATGNPDVQPMFERFDETSVVWQDGSHSEADAVIFATGFRPSLDYLQPVDALDPEGNPHHHLGVSTTVSGLYYMGLSGQRTFASATIRGVGKDAALIGQRIERHLAGLPCCRAAAISQTVSRFTRGAFNIA